METQHPFDAHFAAQLERGYVPWLKRPGLWWKRLIDKWRHRERSKPMSLREMLSCWSQAIGDEDGKVRSRRQP